LVGAESFTLPAGAVQGEHQLAPTPFAQRRVAYGRFKVADDFRGPTRRKQRIGPIFDERGMTFDPSRLFR
jgi:hypothetical protein